jgi:hypothetical protein
MSDLAAPPPPPDKEMNLRYAGICTVCGDEIHRGARAIYSPSTKSVHHIVCPVDDHGVAGASARREYERRTTKDQARVQEQADRVQAVFGHGFIGRVAARIAIDDRPRKSTEVWAQGAVGEERVAARLDELAEYGVVTLHDRRVPGTRANIDHIAVTPWAVWVIDTKRYIDKRPELRLEGGFLGIGGTPRLWVGGRNKDHLVEGVLHQRSLVENVLGDGAHVQGVLCFIDSEWPLIGGDFTVRGVRVCWPKRLAKELLQTAPPVIDVVSASRLLASKFPAA